MLEAYKNLWASMVKYRLIPSVTPWSILNWNVGWHVVDTWSKNGQESTNFLRHAIECRSIHMSQLTLGYILTDTWSSVNHVLFKMLIKCWSSVEQRSIKDIDWHSTVNALMHIIHKMCVNQLPVSVIGDLFPWFWLLYFQIRGILLEWAPCVWNSFWRLAGKCIFKDHDKGCW